MKLSDKTCQMLIKQAKQEGRDKKKSDGGGLYLHAKPSGSAYWRYKYRYLGVQKTLALGIYPETTLAEAREKHREAHKHGGNMQNLSFR